LLWDHRQERFCEVNSFALIYLSFQGPEKLRDSRNEVELMPKCCTLLLVPPPTKSGTWQVWLRGFKLEKGSRWCTFGKACSHSMVSESILEIFRWKMTAVEGEYARCVCFPVMTTFLSVVNVYFVRRAKQCLGIQTRSMSKQWFSAPLWLVLSVSNTVEFLWRDEGDLQFNRQLNGIIIAIMPKREFFSDYGSWRMFCRDKALSVREENQRRRTSEAFIFCLE